MKPFNWKAKKGRSIELPCEQPDPPETHLHESQSSAALPSSSAAASGLNFGPKVNMVRKEPESRRRAFSDFALYGHTYESRVTMSDPPLPRMDPNNNRQRNSNSCGTAASVLASQAATLALSFPHNISVNIESPSEEERASSEERPRSGARSEDRPDRPPSNASGRDRAGAESLLRVSSSDSVCSVGDQPVAKQKRKRSKQSGSEDKSAPTTPVGSKRTSSNASPCPVPAGGSTNSGNSSDRNTHSPSTVTTAGPVLTSSTITTTTTTSVVSTSVGFARCSTYMPADSHPPETPMNFNEEDRGALKILSASSPLITEKSKDSADLSRVKASKYRQKKFLRNFKKQDRLINDFTCALVGDILLQGHLYISENFFAFHSNVFGYITKLLIPLTSVQKVTKEKTAKIIPNAVGVVTSTQKYVFGSLLSRDTTYRIMTRVWKQSISPEPCDAVAIQAPIVEDDSGSGGLNGEEEEEEEEAAVDEDSTSGGGPADLSAGENETADIAALGLISSTPEGPGIPFRTVQVHHPTVEASGLLGKGTAFMKGLYTKAVTKTKGSAEGQTLVPFLCIPRITFLLTIATILLVLLFLAAGVMMLRISSVQEQLLMSRSVPRNKMEIYQEVARWQKELHSNLASEVQLTVEKHLSNIAQVRASLDALYTLFPMTGENGAKADGEDHNS